jgi:hypothetical protein
MRQNFNVKNKIGCEICMASRLTKEDQRISKQELFYLCEEKEKPEVLLDPS